MAICMMETNNSQGLFLKDKRSIYSIKILNPNHIGIINMWVKDCIVDSFQCADIDRIPDLKKNKFTKMTAIQKEQAIQFYCNISNMMFPVQFFINSNTNIFNRICGIESFSSKINLNFTVYLLSLLFKKYQLNFLHI